MAANTPQSPQAGLKSLIERAVNDLAQRTNLPIEDIKLLEARPVIWADASLGCPQPGMVYAQVLTPGFLIRLEAEGRTFEYHAGRGTALVWCEHPEPPAPGDDRV